jgi:hypothetical protein
MDPKKSAPSEPDSAKIFVDAEEEKWFATIPKWLETDKKAADRKDYNAYMTYQLRSRYYEIESDFRAIYCDLDPIQASKSERIERVVKLLQISRNALEREEVDLLSVANLLDLSERSLIWLFPEDLIRKRALIQAQHLKSAYPDYAQALSNQVNEPAVNSLDALKAVYDEVIGEINRHKIQSQINFGLQIERLELLRKWGLVWLLVSIIVLPFLINFKGLSIDNTLGSDSMLYSIRSISPYLLGIVLTLVFSIIGALGGFMSGLLQVRNTMVDLLEFKESLLKFQLKPIVGALTAVIISVLLSWQILPGISIESIGSFILISFLTGFSERYFLKLLQIDQETDAAIVSPDNKGDAQG